MGGPVVVMSPRPAPTPGVARPEAYGSDGCLRHVIPFARSRGAASRD
ncbi:hypothetical protein I547_5528 [Mycobacterium kansasii 824]|nr:hypothetical protein I547_5528 [Mycobacterium kansasii 824]OOK74043.1 hypothetical protein BZL30_4984 [Mycobacterium kansasii]